MNAQYFRDILLLKFKMYKITKTLYFQYNLLNKLCYEEMILNNPWVSIEQLYLALVRGYTSQTNVN